MQKIETKNINIKLDKETYATVEYENGKLVEVFIKIGVNTILVDTSELLSFYALTEAIKLELAGSLNCKYDQHTKAVALCHKCHAGLCSSCGYSADDKKYCNECYREINPDA